MLTLLRTIKKHIYWALKYSKYRLRGPFSKMTDTQLLMKLSSYTTVIKDRYKESEKNQMRLQNMELAISKLNNLIIQPGEIFSFWEKIPIPTKRSGFNPGPTIYGNKLIDGYGGGLCQVSTTLYGALLKCGLKVIERHNHSIDIHGEDRFFQLGLDSAVSFPYKDLVFFNNFNYPVQINIKLDTAGLKCHCLCLTNKPNKNQIKIIQLKEEYIDQNIIVTTERFLNGVKTDSIISRYIKGKK